MGLEAGKDDIVGACVKTHAIGLAVMILLVIVLGKLDIGPLVEDLNAPDASPNTFLAAIALAFATFVYFLLLSAAGLEHTRKRTSALLGLSLASLIYLVPLTECFFRLVNGGFASLPPVERHAVILKKEAYRCSKCSSASYRLELASWRNDMKSMLVDINADTYKDSKVRVGSLFSVKTRVGFLGYEYFVK